MQEKTWEQLQEDEAGTVYIDETKDGLRFLVLRGVGSLCAYVGLPLGHSLAGHGYDDVNIDCHGGLTYSAKGNSEFLPKDHWWYGWDYCHYMDASLLPFPSLSEGHKWLVKEVEEDSRGALSDFKAILDGKRGLVE